jgi:hypothetical protein
VNPTPRSIARFGARLGPPVVVKLFRWVGSAIAAPRGLSGKGRTPFRPDPLIIAPQVRDGHARVSNRTGFEAGGELDRLGGKKRVDEFDWSFG